MRIRPKTFLLLSAFALILSGTADGVRDKGGPGRDDTGEKKKGGRPKKDPGVVPERPQPSGPVVGGVVMPDVSVFVNGSSMVPALRVDHALGLGNRGCAVGWDGETCFDNMLPACASGPGGAQRCNIDTYMSCECYMQCLRASLGKLALGPQGFDHVPKSHLICYHREDSPYSLFPKLGETGVRYFILTWHKGKGPKAAKGQPDPRREWGSGFYGKNVSEMAYRSNLSLLPVELREEEAMTTKGIENLAKLDTQFKAWLLDRVPIMRDHVFAGMKIEEVQARGYENVQKGFAWFQMDESTPAPVTDCPDRCHDNGVCMGGRCICYQGFKGKTCDQVVENKGLCVNGCRGHGTCVAGFCACKTGFVGIDCGLKEKEWVADHTGITAGMVWDPPPPTKFKVYVYELPSFLHHVSNPLFNQGWDEFSPVHRERGRFQRLRLARSAEYVALEQMLRDTSVITTDPREATLFFVPILSLWNTHCRFGDATLANLLGRISKYIEQFFPFWGRRNGRDHVFWHTSDIAQMGVENAAKKHAVAIWMHHRTHKNVAGQRGSDFRKDIVIPPRVQQFDKIPDVVADPGSRQSRWLMFFAGGCKFTDNPLVVKNLIRPKTCQLADSNSDIIIWNNSSSFGRGYESIRKKTDKQKLNDMAMEEAEFCFAPQGMGPGYGDRLYWAIGHGCIPVIIQKDAVQPFEEFLDYPSFSITANEDEIEGLADRLRSIPSQKKRAMRDAVARQWVEFSWEDKLGGRALQNVFRQLEIVAGRMGFLGGDGGEEDSADGGRGGQGDMRRVEKRGALSEKKRNRDERKKVMGKQGGGGGGGEAAKGPRGRRGADTSKE